MKYTLIFLSIMFFLSFSALADELDADRQHLQLLVQRFETLKKSNPLSSKLKTLEQAIDIYSNQLMSLPEKLFEGFTNLKELEIFGNKLSQTERARIKAQLPNVHIISWG